MRARISECSRRFDQGEHWVRIGDVPSVRVDDIQIHPRTSDLVIATHGRSIAILDDSIPFREFTPEIAAKPAHLFSVRSVTARYLQPGFVDSNGKGVYRGQNPADGALFTVWVREFTGDEIKLLLPRQPANQCESKGPRGTGLHSFELGFTADQRREGRIRRRKAGAIVSAGDYTAELTFGSMKMKQNFHVDLAEGITPR
jgi:hypothetical protein